MSGQSWKRQRHHRAGLCAALVGKTAQIENSSEITLEHRLGMTCDPVEGLVQVSCIERNGLGAIKALSPVSLALRGDGENLVQLNACRETSSGGLAVNAPNC